MNTILKYPGGKNKLAKWICSYIPKHKVYLEPFFGGGAIFFKKERVRIETINDINGEVYNFFRVLKYQSQELIRLVSLTPYSRDEYNQAYCESNNDLDRALKFYIKCYMGFGCSNRYKNGFRTGRASTSPNPAIAWAKLPESLLFATERLKEAQIENVDAIELITKYQEKDAFIYLDPPYLVDTRKEYLYKNEMEEQQHKQLLNAIKNHPSKIMISSYENELYDQELEGWIKVKHSNVVESGHSRVETLYMNYDLQLKLDLKE